MTNKSGQIGTRTETDVVRYAWANGFEGADEMTRAQRLRLTGAADQGDVGLCPGVILSIKGGHMAENASDNQIVGWLVEMEQQRLNRGVDIGVLVLKRKGKGAANAGLWWAIMPGSVFTSLVVGFEYVDSSLPSARITLAEACGLLRRAGYGSPLVGV